MDAENSTTELKSRKRKRIWRIAVIGALVLAVLILTGVKLAKHFAAKAFFEKNGISTENLLKEERGVYYREIKVSDQNGTVLAENVPGIVLQQKKTFLKDVDGLMETCPKGALPKTGITYKRTLGFSFMTGKLNTDVLVCYKDDAEIWQASFSLDDYQLTDGIYTSCGTIAWGTNNCLDYDMYGQEIQTDNMIPWLARLDNDGNLMWQKNVPHGFYNEEIIDIIENDDGTLSVFSYSDHNNLCMSRIDSLGNELSYVANQVGFHDFAEIIPVETGYVARIAQNRGDVGFKLLLLDKTGKLQNEVRFESAETLNYVMNMIEYSGKLYLSCYSVPMQDRDGICFENANMAKYIAEEHSERFFEEDNGSYKPKLFAETVDIVTNMSRKNYSALLLVCDSETLKPDYYYLVDESLGNVFWINNDGVLEWNVGEIIQMGFSGFSGYKGEDGFLTGVSNIYRYVFDSSGSLTYRYVPDRLEYIFK